MRLILLLVLFSSSFYTQAEILSALVFYAPRTTEVRPLGWPERFSFAVASNQMDVVDVSALLESQSWQAVYHCDGFPMSPAVLSRGSYYDGLYRSGLRARFVKGKMIHTLIPSNLYGGAKEDPVVVSYKISKLEDGDFFIDYLDSIFFDERFRLLKIFETHEFALEFDTRIQGICRTGVTTRVLFVPIPTS